MLSELHVLHKFVGVWPQCQLEPILAPPEFVCVTCHGPGYISRLPGLSLEEGGWVDLGVAVSETGGLEPVTLADCRGVGCLVAAARSRLPLTMAASLPPRQGVTQCPS